MIALGLIRLAMLKASSLIKVSVSKKKSWPKKRHRGRKPKYSSPQPIPIEPKTPKDSYFC